MNDKENERILYGNGFSPFSRKVTLALEYKQLAYENLDGLAKANHADLWSLNPRGEVPILCDGDLTIANSSHIVAYLEDAYPQPAVYPVDLASRVLARHLENIFDTRVDAILVDCSLWTWADRPDTPPPGLFEAAQADLYLVFDELELHLKGRPHSFFFGEEPSIVEFALWPHLSAVKPLGFQFDPERTPNLVKWVETMRQHNLFRADRRRTAQFIKSMSSQTHERTKIAWRGDRLEWLLSKGFHDWFFEEIHQDRVIWPAEASGD